MSDDECLFMLYGVEGYCVFMIVDLFYFLWICYYTRIGCIYPPFFLNSHPFLESFFFGFCMLMLCYYCALLSFVYFSVLDVVTDFGLS